MQQLVPFIDTEMVKVITGLRRSGKSMLLMLIREHLRQHDINEDQIVYLNFESLKHAHLLDAMSLYQHITALHPANGKLYLLLDEIQLVSHWERVVNSLRVDFSCDIYITGSNSQLLSSELATLLAGRYIEVEVLPLSFREYLAFPTSSSQQSPTAPREAFQTYLRLGGFPTIHDAGFQQQAAYKVINDIYNSVILRDTIERHKIRNVELLSRIIRYAIDNVGNLTSGKNIADYFKSQGLKVDLNTIYNYLNALTNAFVLRKASRYDLQGKEILKLNDKYYLGDHAIGYALMGYHDRHIAGVLENIVYLELLRRGYKAYVGKDGTREIDFVGERNGERIYLQVTYLLASESTVQREFAPLQDIADHYPKYVLSLTENWHENIDGIRHVHLADFLLQEDW